MNLQVGFSHRVVEDGPHQGHKPLHAVDQVANEVCMGQPRV